MTIPPVTQGHAWHARFQRVTFLGTVVPVLGMVLLLASTPASAWMYCWNSPATGIENCWGYAPPWYLHGGGPRTIVWLDGKLMDDTAWTPERHAAAKANVLNVIKAEGAPPAPLTFKQKAAVERATERGEGKRAFARFKCWADAKTKDEFENCLDDQSP